MLKNGVVMDVTTVEQALIAEEAGAVSVMVLDKLPSDVRKAGGVARTASIRIIQEIMDNVTIPVMAKCRIGHVYEANVLAETNVDMIDESEVLTPADPFYHIPKNDFTIPFVCGCTNLGEAVRRVVEGAAMIRTKGEAGTGNVVAAVQHARIVAAEIDLIQRSNSQELETIASTISSGFRRLEVASEHMLDVVDTPFGTLNDLHVDVLEVLGEVREMGRLPVVTFSAGGIATPADAALLMRHGMDGVFVGSGIFKSENPITTAEAIVMATHHFDDAEKVAEASTMMAGRPMEGLEIEKLDVRMDQRGH